MMMMMMIMIDDDDDDDEANGKNYDANTKASLGSHCSHQ